MSVNLQDSESGFCHSLFVDSAHRGQEWDVKRAPLCSAHPTSEAGAGEQVPVLGGVLKALGGGGGGRTMPCLGPRGC